MALYSLSFDKKLSESYPLTLGTILSVLVRNAENVAFLQIDAMIFLIEGQWEIVEKLTLFGYKCSHESEKKLIVVFNLHS